jgi:hypothetical protein
MTHESTDSAMTDEMIIATTRVWLERAVIGLNLCPFARAPYIHDRVRFVVSQARDIEALMDDLLGELQSLNAADVEDCETTLLILPFVLEDFLDFNDFLDDADAAIDALKLEGVLQVASFHPEFQFADTAPDDIENYTNRSPYPILHLLRESSIERAVDAVADPDAIYERNIETLRGLGQAGWNALWTNSQCTPK